MVATAPRLQLVGRVIIHADIHLITGLHIGVGEDLGIGKATEVLRDPLTSEPYIPGSSLRGKIRSLAERVQGIELGKDTTQDIDGSKIHACKTAENYQKCIICPVFGVTSDMQFATPTRLIVRDARLGAESSARLKAARTDLPFTEVKTEVAIDRVTSAAVPRDIARIPAGAVFNDAELSFALYEEKDIDLLRVVFRAMSYLEDDYLGGHGARGYGRVAFKNIRLTAKDYRDGHVDASEPRDFSNVQDVHALWEDSQGTWDWLAETLPW
jgi:CRISPR-associated protein Csm3